jgi:serine/threonine-protein kinase TNNI3K
MLLLRLLPLLLAALSSVGAVSMEAVKIYSGPNCAGTPDVLAIYNTTANCAVDACSDIEFGNGTYYMSRTCNVSDRFTHVEQVFGDFPYLVMETYDNESCATFGEADAFLASGSCEISSGFGDQSAITSLFANGSAVVALYPNDACGGEPSLYFELDKTALATSSCQQDLYRFYSSESSSDVGSSSTHSSTSGSLSESGSGSDPSNESVSSLSGSTGMSDSGSHGADLGTGAIVGIAAAGVVVALVVALIVGYRLRNKRDDDSDKENDGFNDLQTPSDGHKKNSSLTAPGTLDSRSSGSTKPLSLVGLWDDEVIATARIPREKVVIERPISRGGGGEVFLGRYNQQQVAIKMLLPEFRKSVKHVNAFLAEVKLMATLEHARIVLFVGVAWDSLTDLCVVSEFMEGGDLRALLASYEKERRPNGFDRTKVTIALHVAHALTYLHSLETPVLHRDLKSKNVLLTADLEAKLTDFGISRERVDKTMTAGVGTSLWMAPEVMLGQRYDDKADMFSFGVVLSELDRQALPYANAKDNYGSDTAILQLVAQGKVRVGFSSGALESMVSLGNACVAIDPKDRPTAAEALYRLQTILSQEM